jgi:hypothetical protein
MLWRWRATVRRAPKTIDFDDDGDRIIRTLRDDGPQLLNTLTGRLAVVGVSALWDKAEALPRRPSRAPLKLCLR